MILITSLSIQDKLDLHGRRKAYVMEMAGPHSPDEFVVEISDEIYRKLLRIHESISDAAGAPIASEGAQTTQPVVPSTPEEFESVRKKLIEEESRHSSVIPEEFAGRPLSPEEASLLVGIGIDFAQDDTLGAILADEDDGELMDEDADQL